MSEREDTPSEPMKPLAKMLFGWAFAPRKAGTVLIALAAVSAVLLGDEAVRGRAGLNLPYEPMIGFYTLAGVFGASVVLVLAHALKFVFGRLPLPGDEP